MSELEAENERLRRLVDDLLAGAKTEVVYRVGWANEFGTSYDTTVKKLETALRGAHGRREYGGEAWVERAILGWERLDV